MSVGRGYAVVEGPQIRARHDEVHVMITVVVLLKIQGNDLCTLQFGRGRNGSNHLLKFFPIFGEKGGRKNFTIIMSLGSLEKGKGCVVLGVVDSNPYQPSCPGNPPSW